MEKTEQEVYIPKPRIVAPRENLNISLGSINMEKERERHRQHPNEPNVVLLKVYTMMPKGELNLQPDRYKEIEDNIAEKVLDRKIKPLLGLGFLIISDGIVNNCIWGGEFPFLLNQNVYSFSPKAKTGNLNLEKLSLAKSGTFCCWEGEIVGFESNAWRQYLNSPQKYSDMDKYLGTKFEGIIN